MEPCHTCGNVYAGAFVVEFAGGRYTFDCFECAAHALAPACAHCGCRILGHGVDRGGNVYCCDHCARATGQRPESLAHEHNA